MLRHCMTHLRCMEDDLCPPGVVKSSGRHQSHSPLLYKLETQGVQSTAKVTPLLVWRHTISTILYSAQGSCEIGHRRVSGRGFWNRYLINNMTRSIGFTMDDDLMILKGISDVTDETAGRGGHLPLFDFLPWGIEGILTHQRGGRDIFLLYLFQVYCRFRDLNLARRVCDGGSGGDGGQRCQCHCGH